MSGWTTSDAYRAIVAVGPPPCESPIRCPCYARCAGGLACERFVAYVTRGGGTSRPLVPRRDLWAWLYAGEDRPADVESRGRHELRQARA